MLTSSPFASAHRWWRAYQACDHRWRWQAADLRACRRLDLTHALAASNFRFWDLADIDPASAENVRFRG